MDRHLELGQDDGHGDADGLGGTALADQPLAPLDRARTGLALGLGGPHQRVGATVEGAGAFLARAEGQPGVHLGLAGGAGRIGQPLALGGVGLLVGGVVRRGQAALEVGEPGQVLVAGLLGGRDRVGDPLGLGAGRARGGAVVAELLGHGGQGRVGLVQLGQRDVDPALGVEALGLETGDVEAEPLGGGDRLGQLGRGVVVGRLDLQQAGLRRGAAGGEVGAVDVALAGHRGDVGQVGDQRAGGVEVGDDRGLEEQAGQRGPQGVGARHDVDGVRRVAGEPGPGAVVGHAAAEQQPGAAEVTGLEVVDRRDGGVAVGDGHRIGGRAQRRRDRGLVAAVDGQHGRHRARADRRRSRRPRAGRPRRPCGSGRAPGPRSGPAARSGRGRPGRPPREPSPGARSGRRARPARPRARCRGPPRRHRGRRSASRER